MSIDCAEPVRPAAKLLNAEPTFLQSFSRSRSTGFLVMNGPEHRVTSAAALASSARRLPKSTMTNASKRDGADPPPASNRVRMGVRLRRDRRRLARRLFPDLAYT